MKPAPIAYVAPDAYAFVAKDIDGLRARGAIVLDHLFKARRPWQVPMAMAIQLAFLLRARRAGVREVIAHFAGYHTVLPVLLGFRTHIIIAGADACSFPGIRYGSFRKPLMRAAMAYSMRRAATLLPVHPSLGRFTNTYSESGPRDQGYRHFVKRLRTPEEPVPYGFDHALWPPPPAHVERRGAICVAMGASDGNAIHLRKGIDLIVSAAEVLPNIPFTIVGASAPASYGRSPANLRVLGRMGQAELRELLHAHSIYLQPSVMEGFPNALCEAMLCGCLPVVSDMTSMPEIAGDCGAVLPRRDHGALIEAIRRLHALAPEEAEPRRLAARSRILPFTLERRIARLQQVVTH